MKIYNPVYSLTQPQEIELTDTKVFVASNVQQVTREVEGSQEQCYSYILTEYTKDEYITTTAQTVAALQEELQATKILLGVE